MIAAYRKHYVDILNNLSKIEGACILELGSDHDYEIANLLVDLGAKEVFATNLSQEWVSSEPPKSNIINVVADARKLQNTFNDNKFDIVLGIAILEHVNGIPEMIDSMLGVLKQRAVAFTHGGPIWSGPRGHHLWVNSTDNNVLYDFNNNNPVSDWSHLYLTPDEMIKDLLSKGISPEDSSRIAEYIYYSSNINRIGLRDLNSYFAQSMRLENIIMDSININIPNHLIGVLDSDRNDIHAVSYLLRK